MARTDVIDIFISEGLKKGYYDLRCGFVWILLVVYFPVKHSCLYSIVTTVNLIPLYNQS